MSELETNDSVQNEQFGNAENTGDDATKKEVEKNTSEESPASDSETSEQIVNESEKQASTNETSEGASVNDSEEKSENTESETTSQLEEENVSSEIKNNVVEETDSVEENKSEAEVEPTETEEQELPETEVLEQESVESKEGTTVAETEPEKAEPETVEESVELESKEVPVEAESENDISENTAEEQNEESIGENNKSDNDSTDTTDAQSEPEEKIDFAKLTQEQLVNTFDILLETKPIEKIKNDLETIKSIFYKNYHQELEAKKQNFLDDGGKPEDFKPEPSQLEIRLKDLLSTYRIKRDELTVRLEKQKDTNLEEKYKIIEEIKELVNSQESLNKTFQEFRDLQERWRKIGPVPQKNVKDLWEKYHFQVEAFYDYIKINKELRDLDFKKNLEVKISICEKAEELILEPSVVEAFRNLQDLHDQWREVGPVPPDQRTELWERFKEATAKINKRHQEYFVNLKKEQKQNLEEKTVLCEKAEELAETELASAREWDEKSKEIIELQKVWKTIGFAPRKHNTKIYERFRGACDKFFDKKRTFFSHNREEQQNNLQIKTELCIQAEALQDSTDWKKTTDELIALQKKWKEVGPVPSKQSDKIWKRFRAACDKFFNNKSAHFNNIDSEYEENLKKKQELIKEVEEFELTDDVQINLDTLKTYQRRWSEIGFVPIKLKDEIQNQFREIINKRFDELKVDEEQKNILKFKTRIDNILTKPNHDRRLNAEREKCISKLHQLQNDIKLWENNIGFFANSKNAEHMIKDVQDKIENAKKKMEMLKEKIKFIDSSED